MIEDADDPNNPNALKNLPVQPATANVLVRGYWKEGDGGRGLFYSSIDPQAADGGIIIAAPGGYWIRILNEPLNVRWFDARGDGVTDDRQTIQRAIDTAYQRAHRCWRRHRVAPGKIRCG
jgi:hypothetical protein